MRYAEPIEGLGGFVIRGGHQGRGIDGGMFRPTVIHVGRGWRNFEGLALENSQRLCSETYGTGASRPVIDCAIFYLLLHLCQRHTAGRALSGQIPTEFSKQMTRARIAVVTDMRGEK